MASEISTVSKKYIYDKNRGQSTNKYRSVIYNLKVNVHSELTLKIIKMRKNLNKPLMEIKMLFNWLITSASKSTLANADLNFESWDDFHHWLSQNLNPVSFGVWRIAYFPWEGGSKYPALMFLNVNSITKKL